MFPFYPSAARHRRPLPGTPNSTARKPVVSKRSGGVRGGIVLDISLKCRIDRDVGGAAARAPRTVGVGPERDARHARAAGGDEADRDVDALAAVGRPVDVLEV